MILLSGNSLARRTWFGVESMSLTLSGQDSSASLTVGPDAPEISLGDWLIDDTEPGSGIVWRVSRIENQIPGDTRTSRNGCAVRAGETEYLDAGYLRLYHDRPVQV